MATCLPLQGRLSDCRQLSARFHPQWFEETVCRVCLPPERASYCTALHKTANSQTDIPLPLLCLRKHAQKQVQIASRCHFIQHVPHCFSHFVLLCGRSTWTPLCSDPKAKSIPAFFREHCSNSTSISCSPTPDKFNPCQDIVSPITLRILIWMISVLALLGNAMVILVLLGNSEVRNVNNYIKVVLWEKF